MSLRNKRTGEIADRAVITVAPYNSGVRGCHAKTYRSVDEFNEEWEDYHPLAELVEQAKAEARQNLSGEDLEKCYKALEAWVRNTMTTVG